MIQARRGSGRPPGVTGDLVSVAAIERHVTGIFDKPGLHQSPEHRRVLAVLTFLRT